MKISYQWLQEYIALTESPETIAHRLTMAGLEVEGIEQVERLRGGLRGVVVGHVLTCERHPNADKLSITTVDVGADAALPIVCGAPNVAAGQKVLVALEGATLYPTEGEPFVIKKSKIRGEVSQGMICAEDELGLGTSHDGIIVLDEKWTAGTPAAQVLNLESDAVFEIGLTPNRADAASHFGVARDLKALLGREAHKPSVAGFPTSLAPYGNLKVSVADAAACPRYCAVVLQNVKVAPSPGWLKQRLEAIGLNSINNVVDITNYVLHGLGQPLHAFDLSLLSGAELQIRLATPGEKLTTLHGAELELHADDLVIADGEKPVALAGAIGSNNSGVTDGTTSIVIESAYFDPAVVRASSMRHGLKTDASYRFERGTDPDMPLYAAKLAALLLVEHAGAEIAGGVLDLYPAPILPKEVSMSHDRLSGLMGIRLENDQVYRILNLLDITTREDESYGHPGFADSFVATVPPYRVDVHRPADIAEEVLRIYGLDNVPLSNHASASFLAPQPINDVDKLHFRVAAQLAAMGWLEMVNNSLTAPRLADLTTTQGGDKNVVLLNPLSEELSAMRQSLVFTGLNSVAHNLNRQQKNLKLFEFGKVYALRNAQATDVTKRFDERWQLGLFVSGKSHNESWLGTPQDLDYFSIRQATELVLQRLITATQQPVLPQALQDDDRFSFGQQYVLNKRVVAKVGLLNAAILKAMGIKQAVYYAELDWSYLTQKFKPGLQVTEIPRFPAVRRDLSLVLDSAVTYEQVRQIALKTERKLLTDVQVISVYQGENLGEGKKSYALAFTLQSLEATLTDTVIDSTMQRLMDAFVKQLGAIIRS